LHKENFMTKNLAHLTSRPRRGGGQRFPVL
jgi:hypothetical protein